MVNMKKKKDKKSYTIYDIEIENRDQILRESRDAIHNYVKNGVRNEQLKKLIEVEEEFQKKYARCFDVNIVIEQIQQIDKSKLVETQQVLGGLEGNAETRLEDISQIMERVVEVASKTISETVANMLENVAYLSNMNMLYELYEKEERIRREQEEFQKRAEEAKYLYEIASQLSRCRRMELEEIRKEIEVSKEELEYILNKSASYFNIKERGDKTQVSLSPKGIKFTEYVMEEKGSCSINRLNQIVYQDCYNLLETIEQVYGTKKKKDIDLEGLSPERKRAIRQKYIKTLHTILEDDEKRYEISKDGYQVFFSGEESALDGDEKNRFNISTKWDETVF